MINFTPFETLTEQLSGEQEDRLKNASNVLSFGIPYLDDAMVGIFKNDLVVLAGGSGGGKSEVATHISLVNALMGKKVYHLALEAERKEIARRMLFKRLAHYFYENSRNITERPSYLRWYAGLQEDLLGPYHADAVRDLQDFSNLKIFYRGANFGMKELEQIFSSVKFDADLITLDHLHYVDFDSENENSAYKAIVKQIRDLALAHGIPVLLVAHVRKSDRRNASPVPGQEDIHGSSDIFKIATKVVTLAPAKDQAVTPETKTYRFPTYFKIAKCRQDGSLSWFTALTTFDMSKSDYDPDYLVGDFNSENEFQKLLNKPFWAKRAR